MKPFAIFLLIFLLVACAPAANSPVPTPLPSARPIANPTRSPIPAPTRAPTWTPEPSATPLSSVLTPDPFSKYSIDALRKREYGGGAPEDLGKLEKNKTFTRYSIRYPSDGLKIYGFMDLPKGDGPFPVIIILHGYVDPGEYKTRDYTTAAADDLANQGYLVLHPNYRNYGPSDQGDDLFRVGDTIDVLNLIALVREKAGKPGLFEHANPDRIGLWGHSMGGNIALKVAVVSPYIKAILLYSGMSGDELKNSQFFNSLNGGSRESQEELRASPQDFAMLSPDRYYAGISAAIQIHHSNADPVVPLAWAQETCQKLKAAGRQVECFYYDGADHTFRKAAIKRYSPRKDVFFANYLKK